MIQKIDKFIFPGLLILVGLVLLSFGIKDEQTSWFLIGAAALLVAGVVMTLFQLGIINKSVSMIVGLLFLAGSAGLSWMDYRSVQGKIEQDAADLVKTKNVIQGLKDLRTAQLAFKDVTGTFTNDHNKLKNFVKSGKIILVKAEGQVPDSLEGNEAEAIALGIIKRDTSYVNALDSLFLSPYVQEGRVYEFNLDSLPYARLSSGEKFKMESGNVRSSGRNVPVLQITEPVPLNKKEPLMLGSMDRASTAGNWKDVK